MSRTLLPSVLLPFLFAACGGNVVVDGSPGASTTGGGGAATTGGGGAVGTSATTGTVGLGGAGGFQTGTAVVGASTTTVGAGGSTTTGCIGTFFQLTTGTETVMLESSCTRQSPPLPVPFGQEFNGGPSTNPGTLTIDGCVSSATNSQGVVVSAPAAFAPGTYMVSSAGVFTGQGTVDLSGTLQIETFGPVGGTITGSFELGQGQLMTVGKFIVCRAPDLDAP